MDLSGTILSGNICLFSIRIRRQPRWSDSRSVSHLSGNTTTPFQKLYDLDAYTLLLGVGFNRCTSLHYAESLVPRRRATLSRYPVMQDGKRVWVEKPDMAADNGVHFPIVGKRFVEEGHVHSGKIGDAESMLFSTRALVDFAAAHFRESLK